jgi:hypothetical protein
MPEHTVRQGDCIFSIAESHGFNWETIWNHARNAELKQNRTDPNVLNPGDVVFIPEKEEKAASCVTAQRHRFRRKRRASVLRLRLMADDEPRANEPYTLEIEGNLISGTTDHDGVLEQPISPTARRGRILVGEAQDEYLLNLGHVDPITEISGVQGRLNNLGFDCGRVDGFLGPRTETAISNFQIKHDLEASGTPDEPTRNRIVREHGS